MKPALISLLLSFISVHASTLSNETNNFDENEYVILPNLLEIDDCGYVNMETGAPESKNMEIEASPFNWRTSSVFRSLLSFVSPIKQGSPSLPSSPISIESDIKANLEVESDGKANLVVESDGKADSKVESVLKAYIEAESDQSKLRVSLNNLPVSSASSFSDPSSPILEMERIIELKRNQKENMERKISKTMKKKEKIEKKIKKMEKETMEKKLAMKIEQIKRIEKKMEKIEKEMEHKRKKMEKMEKNNLNFSLKSPSSDFSSSSSYQKSLYLSPKCRNRPQFKVIKKYTHSWEYEKVCRKHGMVPAEVTSDNIYSAVSAISKAGCGRAWIKSWNANSYAGSLILIDPDNTFYLRVDKDIVTYDWLESHNAALCMRA